MLRNYRIVSVLIMFLIIITLTGCNAIGIDVENQLRPPKNNGEQEVLQNALEEYILSAHNRTEPDAYSLKYPKFGQYRSSFVLLDELKPHIFLTQSDESSLQPEHMSEKQGYCIAFYRMDTENAKTHIHLLQYEDGKWHSIADVEGAGQDIHEIEFADIDGDAFPEMLIGWNVFNTQDKRLESYSLKNHLQLLDFAETYTALTVADMTFDAKEDILLFSVSTAGQSSSVRLISYENDAFSTVDTMELDGNITNFSDTVTRVAFSKTLRGVFIDAYKESEILITELVTWDGHRLNAPLSDNATHFNEYTARLVDIPSMDIDDDGVVEWPANNSEKDQYDDSVWKMPWYYYDPVTKTVQHDFNSVINYADGYLIKSTDTWPENFTVEYDAQLRLLKIFNEDQVILKLQTTTSGKKSELQDKLSYFDKTKTLHYAVWMDESLNVTTEELSYLFLILEKETAQ